MLVKIDWIRFDFVKFNGNASFFENILWDKELL